VFAHPGRAFSPANTRIGPGITRATPQVSLPLAEVTIAKALKESGRDTNTVIIFTSDSGGLSTGRGRKAPTRCLPLRARKAWVYEGGVRQPLIIKWPGVTRSGDLCHTPVISADFYPTMLEMADLPLRPAQHRDESSLAPVLRDRISALERDALFFQFPHAHHLNSMGPSGAVRVGDYKLAEACATGEVELFNLREDLGARHDPSKRLPGKTREHKERLHRWITDTSAR